MAITSRFAFVGDLVLPKAGARRPFIKDMTIQRHGKEYQAYSLNFGIKASDTNMAFVECFDSVQDVIKTMSTDNEKIEIDWKDRAGEDVLATVAGYRKYVIDLGEEYGGRQEFVSGYDFIVALKDILPTYEGRIMAMGQFTKEWYDGKNGGQYYDHFKLQNVFAPKEDRKNRLALTMELYYNRDSIDDADWKSEKKIVVNGYISQYVNKDVGNQFFPMSCVFSGAKYDPENEKHKALLDYKLSHIQTKEKTMQKLVWEMVLLRGAEEAEFTEDMLTPQQKVQLELGIRTLDDFKPRGKVLGNNINEYRLFDPVLRGENESGAVDCGMTMDEFESMCYVPVVDENLDEVIKRATEKKAKAATKAVDVVPDDDDSDDLF